MPSALPFPDIFIEGAWRPPDLASPFYDQPGVYFMNRHDPRGRCDDSGNTAWVVPKNRTPSEHGHDIYNGQVYLRKQFRNRWISVNKPFKVAHLIVGAAAVDCTVARLNRHPADQPNHLVYFKHGREESRDYWTAALATYEALRADSNEPRAEAVFDDFEIAADAGGGFGIWDGHIVDASKGWWALAQADPRFRVAPEFGSLSIAEWATAPQRKLLLDGRPVPPMDPKESGYHPKNQDPRATADETACRAVLEAAHQALGIPAAAIGLRHGSWPYHSRSRAFPWECRPNQFAYNLDGDFPLGLQIVVNFSDPPSFRSDLDNATRAKPDPHWETPANWLARALELGATIPDTLNPYERHIRATTFFRKREALTARRAAPTKPLWVCIQCQNDPAARTQYPDFWPDITADPQFLTRAKCMIDFLVYCTKSCDLAGVWFFAPGYDFEEKTRARVQLFIDLLRDSFSSGVSPVSIGV